MSGPLKGKSVEEEIRRASLASEEHTLPERLTIPSINEKYGAPAIIVPGQNPSRVATKAKPKVRLDARESLDTSKLESERRRIAKLMRELGPLTELLKDDRVSDIWRNPEGDIWLNRMGEGVSWVDYPMSDDVALSLIGTISEFMGQPVSTMRPIVEGILPSDKSRFSALIPPASNGGPMFSIRKRAVLTRTFDDYIDDGAMTSDQAAFIRKRIRLRDNFLIVGSTGSGKALDVETKIITPNGWKKIGDIKTGDLVMGRNGRPTRVRGVFPQGKKPAFKVTFDDGATTICCDEHLWNVSTKYDRYGGRGEKVLSLAQIKEKIEKRQKECKFAIPTVAPLQFPKRKLPIDPYLLGVLIGDGNCHGSLLKLTSTDSGIVQEVQEILEPTGTELVQFTPIDYRIRQTGWSAVRNITRSGLNPMTIAIGNLGLRVRSHEKFLPNPYKFGHLEARIELLQGLMDTDGSVVGNGAVEYSTSSKQLSEDIVFLIQSLGGTASVTERYPSFTYLGEKKVGRLSYRIRGALPPEIKPFRLERKANTYINRSKYPVIRQFEKIESVGEREMICIAVDAPDHLYVVDHCVVTHNTTLGNAILIEMSRPAPPDERFIILEDTAELQCKAPQTVMLLSSPGLNMEELLKAIMRHSPTRICVGELRGSEAHTLIKAWNTGHSGGLATIHAENAARALDRLEDLIREANIMPSKRKIGDSVNCVIVIERNLKGQRKIKEVVRITSGTNDTYFFSSI